MQQAVGRDAHAVIEQAKAVGVYVFAGGIDERAPPVLVSADGTVVEGGYRSSLQRFLAAGTSDSVRFV